MHLLNFDYNGVLKSRGREIADAAKELSDLFEDGYYLWLARLYDKSGGFYYSDSARDNDGFLPDIESTCQAAGILSSLGIARLSELPPQMKEEMLGFAKGLEDEGDGYFYHPQWGKDITLSRKGRDLDSATSVIRQLGGKPDYPTALERISSSDKGADDVPEYLRSKDAFLKWLVDLDLPSDSYPKGHILDSLSSQIKAAGLSDVCVDFLNSLQYPETGLWEKEHTYASANGMLKISTVYPRFERAFPNILNAARTQIETALFEEPAMAIVNIYNPWVALGIFLDNAEKFYSADIQKKLRDTVTEAAPVLLRATKRKLELFKKPDGSFSYFHNCSAPISQGAKASLGVYEGDVNASALALITKNKPFSVLGIDPGSPTTDADRVAFFRVLGYEV